MTIEVKKSYYKTGELWYEAAYLNGEMHGALRGYRKTGEQRWECYYLYGSEVTKEEYREHELIEELSRI